MGAQLLPLTPLGFIVGVVLLAIGAGRQLAILRMSDAEFAQGTVYSRTSSSTDRPPISI